MGMFTDKYTGSMSGVVKKGKPVAVTKGKPKRPGSGMTDAMIAAVGGMASGGIPKTILGGKGKLSTVKKKRGF